jgi:uncharacterized protein (DUF1778 family)
MKTRDTRLYVRTDAAEKSRIEHAANLAHLSVSDFVRIAVEDRAEAVIAAEHSTTLSAAAFEAFYAALDAPAEPNDALRLAAEGQRAFAQE